MGWTSTYFGARPPNTEERNTFITQKLEHERCRIIDRSGWLDYNKRQFLLLEITHPQQAEPFRLIVMVTLEHRDQQLFYREDSEEVGPRELDCPLRLMKQLEGYGAPTSEYSVKWREKVLACHRDQKDAKAVLRKLRNNYDLPNKPEFLILKTGETVLYRQGTYNRRRNVSAYRQPFPGGGLTLLKPEMIDAVATLAMWQAVEAELQAAAD